MFLIHSHSLDHKIHPIYERQLSLTTRFTVTTLTKVVTIPFQSELPSLSSSTPPFSASFQPTSFAFNVLFTFSYEISDTHLSAQRVHFVSFRTPSLPIWFELGLACPLKRSLSPRNTTTSFFAPPVPVSTPCTPVSRVCIMGHEASTLANGTAARRKVRP